MSVPGSDQVSRWRVGHALAARVGCARRTAPLQRRRGQSLFVPGQDTQLRLAWIRGVRSDIIAVKQSVIVVVYSSSARPKVLKFVVRAPDPS